jgi:hypothetical protein
VTVAVEITSRCLRLAAVEDGTITELKELPIEPGSDPVQLLPTILPARSGGVRVLLANEEMLVRMIIHPPCPRERLDRIIGFELTGGGEDDAPLADWAVVPGFGSGDLRVLGLAVKRPLVKRIQQALDLAGARLEAVTHPAVGLYQAWRAAGGMGDALLADVGGASTQVAIVRQDELALVRTLPVGMDVLTGQVAELRSLPPAEALRLVSQLRASSPEELQHLVRRQAGQVAVALMGAMKFAKAQLQVDDWQPTAIALAGAGAQVHGFAEAIAERAGMPAKPFNPFATLRSALPPERMDALAGLPAPWAAAIGAASRQRQIVDAMAAQRRAAARFWATDGILRVAAAIAVVAALLAVALDERSIARAGADVLRLGGGEGSKGLVPRAEEALAEVSRLDAQRHADAGRLRWLDAEHRAPRIAAELLAAVATVQHPELCPVALTGYRVRRAAGAVTVELEGFAQSAGRLRTSDALQAFEKGLRAAYPPITAIEERPQPIDRDRQRFHLVISLPDQAP